MNILDKPKNTLNKLILKVFMSFEHIVQNFSFFFYLLGNNLNTFFIFNSLQNVPSAGLIFQNTFFKLDYSEK